MTGRSIDQGASRRRSGLARAVGAAALAAALAGCASTGQPGAQRSKDDPLEPMNRVVFEFNEAIDRAVLKPVAQKYTDWLHPGVRGMVSNFFGNLVDVWTAANQLLQGKPVLALSDLTRFTVNTTFGFLGVVDLASEIGLQKHKEDFGQTLGRWGVGPGPYLVLPFFGMSTVRDAIGLVPDYYGNLLTYADHDRYYWSARTLEVIDLRAGLLPAEKLLEGATIDKYSAYRNGYLQRRRNQVYDGDPPEDDDVPKYDDED
ncbi:MAG: VacJ family lipoprotein [Burkholderiaceae bacterium]